MLCMRVNWPTVKNKLLKETQLPVYLALINLVAQQKLGQLSTQVLNTSFELSSNLWPDIMIIPHFAQSQVTEQQKSRVMNDYIHEYKNS